jgi:hypothetical protein
MHLLAPSRAKCSRPLTPPLSTTELCSSSRLLGQVWLPLARDNTCASCNVVETRATRLALHLLPPLHARALTPPLNPLHRSTTLHSVLQESFRNRVYQSDVTTPMRVLYVFPRTWGRSLLQNSAFTSVPISYHGFSDQITLSKSIGRDIFHEGAWYKCQISTFLSCFFETLAPTVFKGSPSKQEGGSI